MLFWLVKAIQEYLEMFSNSLSNSQISAVSSTFISHTVYTRAPFSNSRLRIRSCKAKVPMIPTFLSAKAPRSEEIKSYPAVSPTTMIAGGRIPASATSPAIVARVPRTICSPGIQPLAITATGVRGSFPSRINLSVISARCEIPIRNRLVPSCG